MNDLSNFTFGDMIRLNSKMKYFPSNPFITVNISSLFFQFGPSMPPLIQNSSSSALGSTIKILETLRLSWTIRQADGMIDFIFSSNSTGWFGFGFGSNMMGADIYLCQDSGNGSYMVVDSYRFVHIFTIKYFNNIIKSSLPQPPDSDSNQGGKSDVINFVDLTRTQSVHKHVVSFSRALDTKDPLDSVISPGPMDMIFAYSNNRPTLWHGPQGRIHVIINLYSTGSSVTQTVVSGLSVSSLKILHGFTMYCAFAFIYPLGIYIARYHQDMAKWLIIHKSLQGLITSNVHVVF